jgi:hypothetical protein
MTLLSCSADDIQLRTEGKCSIFGCIGSISSFSSNFRDGLCYKHSTEHTVYRNTEKWAHETFSDRIRISRREVEKFVVYMEQLRLVLEEIHDFLVKDELDTSRMYKLDFIYGKCRSFMIAITKKYCGFVPQKELVPFPICYSRKGILASYVTKLMELHVDDPRRRGAVIDLTRRLLCKKYWRPMRELGSSRHRKEK